MSETPQHICLLASRVIDSRDTANGTSIRRRRVCDICDKRWTTYELPEVALSVLKGLETVRNSLDECVQLLDQAEVASLLANHGRIDFNWHGVQEVYGKLLTMPMGTVFTPTDVCGDNSTHLVYRLLKELMDQGLVERVNRWTYRKLFNKKPEEDGTLSTMPSA